MAISRAAAIPTYGRRKPRTSRALPPRAPGVARPRIALKDIAAPLVGAVTIALVLTLYIAGYALVASANHDRVALKDQIHSVRSENEVLQTDIDNRRSTEAVADWARANQMVDDGGAQVVIVGSN